MGGAERALIDEVFASNYIAPCGPMVDRFEGDFASAVGLPHACALSSCTAALDLLFHELGVSRGDTVFCSDLTFVASIAPAVHRGATPVFIDCDETTWAMDPDLLAEALAEAGKEGRLPRAGVAVDLYGQCCDYDRLEASCAVYGVPLIVDAAEALGARYWGTVGGRRSAIGGERHAGDAGWAAVYSFNGNKIITTSGGGMLASRDRGVVDRARARSQQAREPAAWYEHKALGYNYRMSNVVAGIGVGQLACLEQIARKKRQIFARYHERLGACVGFMPEAAYGACTRWLTVAELEVGGRSSEVGEQRLGGPSEPVRRVISALESENIESRPVWKPMHLQPVFRGAKIYGGRVSERVFNRGLCLPSGAGLSESDVDRIAGLVLRSMETD
jgi:dTDP-4-amino-4,6-dideoxygalactose transaminase